MAGSPPNYDNVQWPGGDGIRVPTEVFGSGGAGTPGGTIALVKSSTINLGNTASATLNAAQTQSSELIITNASGAATINLPGAFPGQVYVLYNNSGQSATLKVVGQTGVIVANGKRAILVCEATDIARVTADT